MGNLTLDDVCQQYYNKIYGYCLRKANGDSYRADEITSEVFYLLLQKWDDFYKDSPKGILTWLYKAANLKMLEISKKPKDLSNEFSQAVEYLEKNDLLYELKKYDEYIVQIRKKLSAKDRRLFDLVVIDKKSYAEIAEIMDISEHAVQLRWYRLKEKLKKILDVLFQ